MSSFLAFFFLSLSRHLRLATLFVLVLGRQNALVVVVVLVVVDRCALSIGRFASLMLGFATWRERWSVVRACIFFFSLCFVSLLCFLVDAVVAFGAELGFF